jgi:hypothetical protein
MAEKTERRGRVVNTPASYSGGPISAPIPVILSFRGFPQYILANDGIVYYISHDRFLPHSFQFIIQLTSFIRRYIRVAEKASLNNHK